MSLNLNADDQPADSSTTTPDPDPPADSSTTTPDPDPPADSTSSALGGALGGGVFLLLIMAVTVGVVIVAIRSKNYIGVQENRAYHNRNPTYQPEGGERINLLTIAKDVH